MVKDTPHICELYELVQISETQLQKIEETYKDYGYDDEDDDFDPDEEENEVEEF